MSTAMDWPSEPPADGEIVATRVFNAPREVVFRAFTDPDRLARWWGPKGFTNTFHEFDPRPGGAWRVSRMLYRRGQAARRVEEAARCSGTKNARAPIASGARTRANRELTMANRAPAAEGPCHGSEETPVTLSPDPAADTVVPPDWGEPGG